MIDPLGHQRLVCGIAKRYRRFGIPLEDLVAEGQIGLLIACRKFDPSLGNEFSTYAVPWISRMISRAVDRRTIIAVPSHVQERLRFKGSKAYSTPKLLKAGKRAMRRHMNEGSLEASSRQGLSGLVRDRRPSGIRQSDAAMDVACLMGRLTPQQAEVVRLRYGLDGRGERDLQEIGATRGTSWQAAQQSLSRAMDKLRWAARGPEPGRVSA